MKTKIGAILALAFTLTLSHAETYYLLSHTLKTASPGAPLPFNPHQQAPRHEIAKGIWLVDDSAFTTSKVKPNPVEVQSILTVMKEQLAEQRLAFVEFTRTNPPTAPDVRQIQSWPTKHKINPDITEFGPGAAVLETIYPGISTNFHPSQLTTNREPRTQRQWPKRLPDHISPLKPTFKEDLRQWKIENNIPVESVDPEPLGSGGGDQGDIEFDELKWYKLEIEVLKNPTPNNWDVRITTNETTGGWVVENPTYAPGLISIYPYTYATTPETIYLTNFTGIYNLDLKDADTFFMSLTYPDAVSREVNNWQCVRIYWSAECNSYAPSTQTNDVYVLANYAGIAFHSKLRAFCTWAGTSVQNTILVAAYLAPVRLPQMPLGFTSPRLTPEAGYSPPVFTVEHITDALKPKNLMGAPRLRPQQPQPVGPSNVFERPLGAVPQAHAVSDVNGYVRFENVPMTNSQGFFYVTD